MLPEGAASNSGADAAGAAAGLRLSEPKSDASPPPAPAGAPLATGRLKKPPVDSASGGLEGAALPPLP